MNSTPSQHSVVVVHEDREHCIPGAKLAVLSLRERCEHLPLAMSCPSPPPAFEAWLGRQAGVSLVRYPETQFCAWNVKPTVLLRLLSAGFQEVIWVDSDIIAAGDALTTLTRMSGITFGGTEETYWGQNQGGIARTVAWGLKPGREMPCTVNSGVLRVTQEHLPLLRDWETMMRHPVYVRAQSLPWYERPLHMIGDQEVLTGLLGSDHYSHVPLALLRRGIDIAQCMGPSGFTPGERLRSVRHGLPPLVHSMGYKPWTRTPKPPALKANAWSMRTYYDYLHMELSPYVAVARRYREQLDEPTGWMDLSSLPARLLSAAVLRQPALEEFPLALIDAATRGIRRHMQIARYPLHKEFCLQQSPLL